MQEGRHYIGFELNKEYCKTAKKRIEDAKAELQRLKNNSLHIN